MTILCAKRSLERTVSDEDFCYMVHGKYGGSVGEQAEDLLLREGQLKNQNVYALHEILVLAKRYKPDLASEIEEYLKRDKAA